MGFPDDVRTESCAALWADMDLLKRCFWYHYTFHYVPSETAAYASAGCYAAITLVVLLLTLKFPKARIMWTVVVTGVAEVLGYLLRVHASKEANLGTLIGQSLLLLVAPIALALVNYVVAGRLLAVSGRKVWGLTPRMVSRLFLGSDIGTFLIQGTGGGLMAIDGLFETGKPVVIFGVALQVAFFTAFTVIVFVISSDPAYGISSAPSLRPAIRGLLVTIVLMFIRNIWRLVEFSAGMSGFIAETEWLFYVFETVPIWLSFAAYCWWHFGRLLPDGEDAPWRLEILAALGRQQAQQGEGAKAGGVPVPGMGTDTPASTASNGLEDAQDKDSNQAATITVRMPAGSGASIAPAPAVPKAEEERAPFTEIANAV